MHTMTMPMERPDRSLAAVVLLAALTLVGMIALLPSTEEKAAVLMAEQRYDQAVGLLEDLEGRSGLNRYETFMLARLYLLSGQHENAIMLLEGELDGSPDSDWALQQLVEIYRAQRDLDGEARTLEQRYQRAANAEDYRRLLGLYRLRGRYDNESALLRRAVEDGLATPADTDRLVRLEAGIALNSNAAVWTADTGSFSHFSPGLRPKAAEPLPVRDVTLTPLPDLESRS